MTRTPPAPNAQPAPPEPPPDPLFLRFLAGQRERAAALSAESDRLEIVEVADGSFELTFHCYGVLADHRARQFVVGEPNGWLDPRSQTHRDGFVVRIDFLPDHLRRVDPFRLLTWVGPAVVVHPNISSLFGKICIGDVAPSTPIEDLVYRVWEVITFHNLNTDENNCLNPQVCDWARANLAAFPVDDRPLRQRRPEFTAEFVEGGSS